MITGLEKRFTMLIVDDEYEIREGLRKADYGSFQIEVVAICENGIEALKAMAQTPVDILLTDIKMPLMDGLELISKVSVLYPFTKKIVLSGYGDFEYAKKGIAFGVLDYLLKPLDFEEYFRLLHKTTTMLNEERELQLKQASLERKAKLTAHMLRTKFLAELLQRSLSEEMIELDSAAAEVLLEVEAPYSVCVLRFQSYPTRSKPASDAEWQLVVFALDNLLHDYWDDPGFGYHYVDPVTAQCALIVTEAALLPAVQAEAEEAIKTELERILRAFKRFRGLFQSHLQYRIGPVVGRATEIHHSCLMAEAGFAAAESSASVASTATDAAGSEVQSGDDPDVSHANGRRLVHEVKAFIAGHYDRTITLDEVAQHVHLNASYLSHLFKELTGMKYIEYLTEYRMDKAKSLLADTNWKVYEVGEMVGYENPRYFTLIFKKYTGQSPLEYRNAHYNTASKDG
ncbi:AraC family transcriptional regulator [Paenibacillus sp. J5C_2022]|uniref:response regulator transcription factor n=1 Tax=Paenibacillus sp. J5C2022 TaxID=2977129 RepID=UPI0021D3597D|nr:AraC family transcriptional regulator [Paenibacillus sp. J5C2022]MCU6707353.1 AraC family transcriptional regulator [Paenibacillus sp. J5C2022]